MSETFGNKYGLKKGARSPGSTANAEHYDPAGASKAIDGQPGTVSYIIPLSTTVTALGPDTLIRVVNTSGAVAFLFIGKETDVPVTPDITNSLALQPGDKDVFYCGFSDDVKESIMVKASISTVQIAVMQ